MLKRKRILKISLSVILVLATLMSVFVGFAPLTKSVSSASPAAGRPSDGGVEDQKIIWRYFMDKFKNPYGVAGLMGNLKGESNLITTNLQNSYEKKLGYNDKTYTKAVDDGTYNRFINDAAGYGLAQWTHSSRKRNLLYFAQDRGVSIGDFQMQLDFLYQELVGSFRGVVAVLENATSVREASNAVLLQFERPADQGIYQQNTRAGYSQAFYDKYKDLPLDTETTTKPTEPSSPDTTDPGKDCVPGDVNDDNKIDATDYILIKRHMLNISVLKDKALRAADANEDGNIDATDYITVKRKILFG